jgi:hypothetical protein
MLSGAASTEVFTSATLKRAGTAAGAGALANITFSDAASVALPQVCGAEPWVPGWRPDDAAAHVLGHRSAVRWL